MNNFNQVLLSPTRNHSEFVSYPVGNGQQIGWHKYIQSSELANLTENDIEFLKVYGVRHIIDLRSSKEILKTPSPFGNDTVWDYHHIPLFNHKVLNLALSDSKLPLGELYIELLHNYSGIKKAIQTIVKAENAVLFICSAGKIRTSIISLLLLAVANFYKQDMAPNYESTTSDTASHREKFITLSSVNEELIQSKPDSIIEVYDFLIQYFGSVPNYLLHIGVKKEEIQVIHKRFQTV